MVGGGVVEVSDDFVVQKHVEKAFRSSECRTPIILIEADGDPLLSVCKLAKNLGCAVWQITMGDEKNEQNAIDYIDVGIQNGDWVYLTGCEEASENVLRKIARTLVTLKPEPKSFPRRELFRVWFVIAKPISINDHSPRFPQLLLQNAILGRGPHYEKGAATATSPEKWVKRIPQEPPLFEKEVKKHRSRRDHGRQSDSESDAEEPDQKLTGLWFYRAVDFHAADAGSTLTKASEEIFHAIEKDDAEQVAALCRTGQIDLSRLQKEGMTTLQFACSREKLAAAKVLLEAGADPNQPRASDGCPPLFMALESTDLVAALIDHGGDYYAKFEGCRIESHSSTAPHVAEMIIALKKLDEAQKNEPAEDAEEPVAK